MTAAPAAGTPYVFLSYASIDRARALTIADALESAGVQVWIDREAIAGGTSWGSQIVDGIKNCAALVICCTGAAMASRNVKQEIQLAWRFERAYVPLLLEPVEFPEQLLYFLEGWQWVEVLNRQPAEWQAELLKALTRLGAVGASIQQPPQVPERGREDATTRIASDVASSTTRGARGSDSGAGSVPDQRGARARAPQGAPLVGRTEEIERLRARIAEAVSGQGGLLMLAGEPGIGKTRLAQEASALAEDAGMAVLWGRCYESDWQPPYGPWVEALSGAARSLEPAALRTALGAGAGVVTRLVPAIGAALPDAVPPQPLSPDEERFRLYDAVSQFLLALAARQPLLLVLDDLHWADRDSMALLGHVARFASGAALLLLGLCRDVDLDRQHPLATALTGLRREQGFERLLLRGLGQEEVGALLAQRAGHETEPEFTAALFRETEGNPLFIQETLRHLVESGRLVRQDGRWVGAAAVEELGIPEGVREVIGRRLSRLSSEANRVLTLAAAFPAGFEFLLLRELSGLDEDALLDVIDEALSMQIIRPQAGRGESYEFAHALVRRTLYEELSPSRKVRLHRRIAEVLAARGRRRPEEIAYHYHESAALPGAVDGLPYCEAAVARAEETAAWGQAATFLAWALELLEEDDPRRGRLLVRRAVALAWSLAFEEAAETGIEAGRLIAAGEGDAQAAEALAPIAAAMFLGGSMAHAWRLAADGLRYAGDRRDASWAIFRALDLFRRDAEDPNSPGVPYTAPEWEDVWAATDHLPPGALHGLDLLRRLPHSRAEAMALALDSTAPLDEATRASRLAFFAGEFERALLMCQQIADEAELLGQLNMAASNLAYVARCYTALGDFKASRQAYERGMALAARLVGNPNARLQLLAGEFEQELAFDTGWDERYDSYERLGVRQQPEYAWANAAIRATLAVACAKTGRAEEAVHWIETLVPAVEQASPWAANYVLIVCDAVYALWIAQRTDYAEVLERNLLTKVIEPDFRYLMRDGRLSLARLCALQGRLRESRRWFAEARTVLEEQGCRPLRAICDYDEALTLVRAGDFDAGEVATLLDAALGQFRGLGMSGWVAAADALAARVAASQAGETASRTS